MVYNWDVFGSFKSCAQTAFVCVIFEIAELNAFFLKSTLWLEPSVRVSPFSHSIASSCRDSSGYLGVTVTSSCP